MTKPHASAPRYQRERRDRHARLDRAEKQAQRRLERPQSRVLWEAAPQHCPVCGRGLSDVYRREPHYRRDRYRLPGDTPEWCPGWPFAM